MRKFTVEEYEKITIKSLGTYTTYCLPEKHDESNPLEVSLSRFRAKVHIVSTKCEFGGYRWWFICPKTHKKCLNLYFSSLDSTYYSREVLNLSYASKYASRGFRILQWASRNREIESAFQKIHKTHVKSVPTKKYAKILRLKERKLPESLRDYLSVLERKTQRLERQYRALT